MVSGGSARLPKGRVRIHARDLDGKGGKPYLIEDTSNLIVYRGRNWLMQRAFAKDMVGREGWKDRFISWFAVGTGGAIAGQPLVAEEPSLPNCGLGIHGTIGSGTSWLQCENYAGVMQDFHKFDSGYPQFINDPEIENFGLCTTDTNIDPLDGATYNSDKFLIGMTKTTISADECNGTDYQDISEAGLFISPSNSMNYTFSPRDMEIFARVTFSTIRKTSDRELIFSWLIYF